MLSFLSASFGLSFTLASAVAGWVLYLVKLSTWQRVAVVAGAGVCAVILGTLLSIGINYLVNRFVTKSKLTQW
ncbi:MAG: hypothetical protein GX275_03085 [Clostridiales bacterium]|nr:hypothetical protein [Clostridiales bacterium]